MSRYTLSWNQDKYNKFIKEGRGQGFGKEYKPWLSIHDFPSKGRVSRVLGWKSKRIHHFFSDMQTIYFYMLEWENSVIDIREHYPLLDIEDAIKDKSDLGLEKFKDKESRYPYTLTTNFLITIKNSNNENIYIARSIKSKLEIEKKKTLERLEIERRYWESKDIDWGIVTQNEIPKVYVRNIEWVHSTLYSYEERGFSKEEINSLGDLLCYCLSTYRQSVRKITADFDKEYNYENGTGLFIFRYLIASKKIKINMMEPININIIDLPIEIENSSNEGEGVLNTYNQ